MNNTGLVEVPMGMTLREIIYDIGGGIPGGQEVQGGADRRAVRAGASPESLLDLPVDFDELGKVGSMMGSGGMIVIDEDTCMVDMARYFLDFLTEESCGKCVPCREGIRQMLKILNEDLRRATARGRHRAAGGDLAEVVQKLAAVRLGRIGSQPGAQHHRNTSGTNTRRTSRDKRCPAGVCKALISYYIDPREVPGLHVVSQELRRGGHHAGQEAGPHRGPGRLHQVRDLPRCLPFTV